MEKALGMEDGTIPDSAITSNNRYTASYEPYYGRLKRSLGNGAWCSSHSTTPMPYLQIDFGSTVTVTAVATQGYKDPVNSKTYFVYDYAIQFKKSLTGQWLVMVNVFSRRTQV